MTATAVLPILHLAAVVLLWMKLLNALCALGYSNSEIMPALKQIPNYAELSSEVIIKQALKLFAGRK